MKAKDWKERLSKAMKESWIKRKYPNKKTVMDYDEETGEGKIIDV